MAKFNVSEGLSAVAYLKIKVELLSQFSVFV